MMNRQFVGLFFNAVKGLEKHACSHGLSRVARLPAATGRHRSGLPLLLLSWLRQTDVKEKTFFRSMDKPDHFGVPCRAGLSLEAKERSARMEETAKKHWRVFSVGDNFDKA
jgi:hypothetical protein